MLPATRWRLMHLPPLPNTYFNRRYTGTCDHCGAESTDLRLLPCCGMAHFFCPTCREEGPRDGWHRPRAEGATPT